LDPFSSSPTTSSNQTTPSNTNNGSTTSPQNSRYNSSGPGNNNNQNNHQHQQQGSNMESPQNSNFSVDSQGNISLQHGIKKWIKQDGLNTVAVRPSAPFALVNFCARINAAVYEPGSANSQNSNNADNNTKILPLVDQFDFNKPMDAILGVTRLFKGLEIGLLCSL
jgi:hypothetical protein